MKKVASGAEQPAPAGNVYEDPQGRFSLPLVGNWEQLETDGSYGLFDVTGFDLKMSVHSIECEELEAGRDAALNQAGIDPASLTRPMRPRWGSGTPPSTHRGKAGG